MTVDVGGGLMSYRALYRVWRPQRFSDIVGQQHVTRTLQNALQQKRFSHAYLFSGPRGTGKTSAAKVMAKAVNCEQGPGPEPCNACTSCQHITEGSLLDVVEIDAASNRGVDEIRDLRDKVKYAPTEVRTKVYIIDEVHMLTPEAFNALLKTLEEPPRHVLFILATTEPYKLPLTIISRCQRFDFHRVGAQDMVTRLAYICEQESIQIEQSALFVIARMAEGGLRDALSLLDQAYAFGGDPITEADIRAIVGTVSDSFFHKILSFIAEGDAASVLDTVSELMREGHDPEKFTTDFLHYFRDMLLVRTAPNLEETAQRLATNEHLEKTAQWFTEEAIFAMMEEINHIQVQMKRTNQPRILLELLLVKLTRVSHYQPTAGDNALESLFERVKQLEQEVRTLPASSGEGPAQVEKKSSRPLKPSAPKRQQSGTTTAQLQKVQSIYDQADAKRLAAIKEKWPHILDQVKDRKITVHAWLVDGEPVVATERQLLLAFKNLIHRETTEKPSHKQLIEDAIEQVTGSPCTLMTCMQNEWKRLEAGGAEREHAAAEESSADDHVRQALEWFGADLVEIKE